MTAQKLQHDLKSYLQAGYPALYIQSGEEARVDALLTELASMLQWHPLEFNLGYGWVKFHGKQPLAEASQRTDLASCLPALLDDDLQGKLIVIKDARLALENQELAVARLKQLLNRIQRHHRGQAAVILVSESQFIPAALEAQTTLLHLPLPAQKEITELLQQSGLNVADNLLPRLAATCSGLSQEEIRQVLARVGQHHTQLDERALATIHQEKEQIIAKSGVLEMVRVEEQPQDIGGLENLKHWLQRRAEIFHRLPEAEAVGLKAPKGVLIAGMPGCGKSLTAKAAAGLFQLPLLRLDIGSLLGKYVGESEHNMRRALRLAESVSPCILWIDELEKAFVGMGGSGASEVSSRLFGYFLTWMQEKTGSVFVIATANDITALPPELLRKGRFDEVFYVGFPNLEERQAILAIHLKDTWSTLSRDEQKTLAAQCRDYAGADIQNAVNEARENAFLADHELDFKALEAAIGNTVPLRETLRDKVGEYEERFEKLKLKPASRSSGLTVAQMVQQAKDPNPVKRKEVAENPECPDDLLEALSQDKDKEVKYAVYRNANCPVKVLAVEMARPAKDENFDLESYKLSCLHPKAPMDLLARELSERKDESGFICSETELALAASAHVSSEVKAQLFRIAKNEEAKTLICESTDTNSDALEIIARNDKTPHQSLIRIAKNKHINTNTQEHLANHWSVDVNTALAGNPHIEAEIQKLLFSSHEDTYSRAKIALCGNPNLSKEIFEEILKFAQEYDECTSVIEESDHKYGYQYEQAIPEALLKNPALPDHLQIELAAVENTHIKYALADNSHICAEALDLLTSNSNDEKLIEIVAKKQKQQAAIGTTIGSAIAKTLLD